MLINVDSSKPLYVIGIGMAAEELKNWIQEEFANEVFLIDRVDMANLPNNSQCIPGFRHQKGRQAMLQSSMIQIHSWATYIHPTSLVHSTASIGNGTVVEPMVYIGHLAKIGKFGWVACSSIMGHNDVFGDNVVLNPSTTVLGSVTIGNNVIVGAGSMLRDKITIGSDCEFLMSSVVTKDILKPGKYFGNRKLINLDS